VTRWPIEITLARDPASLLAWLGIRLFTAEIALIVGLQSTGTVRLLILVAGAVVLGYAALLALHALSLRLLIFPEEVRLASLVLRRTYRLGPGGAMRRNVPPGGVRSKASSGTSGLSLDAGVCPPASQSTSCGWHRCHRSWSFAA